MNMKIAYNDTKPCKKQVIIMADQNMENMTLNEMNDYQKLQMTQLSYLDFDMERLEELKGKKLSDAGQYLESPDSWVIGARVHQDNDHWMNRAAEAMTYMVTGQEAFTSEQQLYDRCVDIGMGDLTIKDVISDKETGFQAIALEDQEGNVYFSFRGSDMDLTKGATKDWVQADALEMFKGDKGDQVRQAVEFFDKNKSQTGENAIYGHSLGGNLTSHVFAQRHDEISQAFAYNPNPISERYLDTPEKKQAFQSEKFTIALTEGDWASGFKSFEAYENRAVYIKNAFEEPNAIQNHLAEAATFDKDGNFVQSTKEEYLKAREETPVFNEAIEFIQKIDTAIVNADKAAELISHARNGEWPEFFTEFMEQFGEDATKWVNEVKDSFLDGPELTMGLDVLTPDKLSQTFMPDIASIAPEQLIQDVQSIIPTMEPTQIFEMMRETPMAGIVQQLEDITLTPNELLLDHEMTHAVTPSQLFEMVDGPQFIQEGFDVINEAIESIGELELDTDIEEELAEEMDDFKFHGMPM